MGNASKVILIILASIALLTISGAIIISQVTKNLETISVLPIEDVDLATVPDGIYTGSYNSFPIAVELELTVQGNIITAIKLIKHRNGQGKAAETIPQMVIESQSLKVDVISGATYSSKIILLAIKDALTNAVGG